MFATMLCAVPWWAQGFAILFVAICLVLIALVLLQKGRGGGLASAFGGEGGQSAFGSKTGDVFTWITIVVVVAFFFVAMLLSLGYRPATLEEDIESGTSLTTESTEGQPIQAATEDTGAAEEKATEAEETGSEAAVEAEDAADTAEESVPAEAPVDTDSEKTE